MALKLSIGFFFLKLTSSYESMFEYLRNRMFQSDNITFLQIDLQIPYNRKQCYRIFPPCIILNLKIKISLNKRDIYEQMISSNTPALI